MKLIKSSTLIMNYHSYFESKMKLIRCKKIWMGPLNLYGWNGSFLRPLYKSIIVLHQDCCSILWSPVSQAGDKISLEGPQRSFTIKAWGLL